MVKLYNSCSKDPMQKAIAELHKWYDIHSAHITKDKFYIYTQQNPAQPYVPQENAKNALIVVSDEIRLPTHMGEYMVFQQPIKEFLGEKEYASYLSRQND